MTSLLPHWCQLLLLHGGALDWLQPQEGGPLSLWRAEAPVPGMLLIPAPYIIDICTAVIVYLWPNIVSWWLRIVSLVWWQRCGFRTQPKWFQETPNQRTNSFFRVGLPARDKSHMGEAKREFSSKIPAKPFGLQWQPPYKAKSCQLEARLLSFTSSRWNQGRVVI